MHYFNHILLKAGKKDLSRLIPKIITDKRGKKTKVWIRENKKDNILSTYNIKIIDGNDNITLRLLSEIGKVIDIQKIFDLNSKALTLNFEYHPKTILEGATLKAFYHNLENSINVDPKYKNAFNHEFAHYVYRTLANLKDPRIETLLQSFVSDDEVHSKKENFLKTEYRSYYHVENTLKEKLPILDEVLKHLPSETLKKMENTDFKYAYCWKMISGLVFAPDEYRKSFEEVVGHDPYAKTIAYLGSFIKGNSMDTFKSITNTVDELLEKVPKYIFMRDNLDKMYFNKNEFFARFFEQYMSESSETSYGSKPQDEYKKDPLLYFTNSEMLVFKNKFFKLLNEGYKHAR